jgi:signal transduction histidine kinase
MTRTQRAKIAFGVALLLLCLSGIAAGFVIDRLIQAEVLVHHTYDVEVAIGDFESSLTAVGRTRVAYIDAQSPGALQAFNNAIREVNSALARVRLLTADNPTQQAECDRLQSIADARLGISQESVDMVTENRSDPVTQLQMNAAVGRNAFETTEVTREMRRSEDQLLQRRSQVSQLLFDATVAVLAISFLLSALMFWFHYQLLNREVIERRGAENQLRHLSLQLMRAQDEERRRFARELHDGLGQNLVGAKMLVDTVLLGNKNDTAALELSKVLNDAIAQTRAISYLFHPPLLDEVGFDSAARWLVEGYGQRMGLEISADFSRLQERLPRNAEVTLYRVLQEALNNIYRHSHSPKADVSLRADAAWVTLRVKDYGCGIPSETMTAFQASGPQAGVGLTGMKERVQEQGGRLDVRSDENGTEIIARIPINAELEPHSAAAEPLLRAG